MEAANGRVRRTPADLVRSMSKQVVEQMQEEVGKSPVTLRSFIDLWFRYMPVAKQDLFEVVECLCAMFTDADDDGGTQLSWSEICSYILRFEHRKRERKAISRYKVSTRNDQMMHPDGVDKIIHMPHQPSLEEGSAILAVESGDIKLFSDTDPAKLIRTLPRPPQYPDATCLGTVAYDAENHYVGSIMSNKECRLCFWECGFTYMPKYYIPCKESQTGLWHSSVVKTWMSGGSEDSDFVVSTWSLRERKLMHKLTGHQGIVTCVQDIPNHQFVATASLDKLILLWDSQTLMQVNKIVDSPKGIRTMAYMPEYDFLLSAGFATSASVYSPKISGTRSVIGRLDAHIAPLTGLAVVPNAPIVVTGDELGFVRLWDIRKWECYQVFQPNTVNQFHQIMSIERPGHYADVVLSGDRLHYLHPDTTSPDYVPPGGERSGTECVVEVFLNLKAHTLLVALSQQLQVYSLCDGELEQAFPLHTRWDEDLGTQPDPAGSVTCACMDALSERFVYGSDAGVVAVRYIADGKLRVTHESKAHEGMVTALRLVDAQQLVLSCGVDGAVLCFDALADYAIVRRFDLEQPVLGLSWVPKTNSLLIATERDVCYVDVQRLDLSHGPIPLDDKSSDVQLALSLDPFPVMVFADGSSLSLCYWPQPEKEDPAKAKDKRRYTEPEQKPVRLCLHTHQYMDDSGSHAPVPITALHSLVEREWFLPEHYEHVITSMVDMDDVEDDDALRKDAQTLLLDPNLQPLLLQLSKLQDKQLGLFRGLPDEAPVQPAATGATLILGDVLGTVEVLDLTAVLEHHDIQPAPPKRAKKLPKMSQKRERCVWPDKDDDLERSFGSRPNPASLSRKAGKGRPADASPNVSPSAPSLTQGSEASVPPMRLTPSNRGRRMSAANALRGTAGLSATGRSGQVQNLPRVARWKAHDSPVVSILLLARALVTSNQTSIKIWSWPLALKPELLGCVRTSDMCAENWHMPPVLSRSLLHKFQAGRIVQSLWEQHEELRPTPRRETEDEEELEEHKGGVVESPQDARTYTHTIRHKVDGQFVESQLTAMKVQDPDAYYDQWSHHGGVRLHNGRKVSTLDLSPGNLRRHQKAPRMPTPPGLLDPAIRAEMTDEEVINRGEYKGVVAQLYDRLEDSSDVKYQYTETVIEEPEKPSLFHHPGEACGMSRYTRAFTSYSQAAETGEYQAFLTHYKDQRPGPNLHHDALMQAVERPKCPLDKTKPTSLDALGSLRPQTAPDPTLPRERKRHTICTGPVLMGAKGLGLEQELEPHAKEGIARYFSVLTGSEPRVPLLSQSELLRTPTRKKASARSTIARGNSTTFEVKRGLTPAALGKLDATSARRSNVPSSAALAPSSISSLSPLPLRRTNESRRVTEPAPYATRIGADETLSPKARTSPQPRTPQAKLRRAAPRSEAAARQRPRSEQSQREKPVAGKERATRDARPSSVPAGKSRSVPALGGGDPNRLDYIYRNMCRAEISKWRSNGYANEYLR